MKNYKKDNPITAKTGMLPQEAYDEFKEIFIKEIRYIPSNEQVVKDANNLIELFKLFSKPKVLPKSGQSY